LYIFKKVDNNAKVFEMPGHIIVWAERGEEKKKEGCRSCRA
jgi:hypothetical protein